jgi:preprotein translocase subunit SecG
MYHGSRKMLIFLIVVFLAVNISCGVLTAIGMKQIVGGKFHLLYWRAELIGQTKEEAILSGTYACSYDIEGNAEFLSVIIWILTTAWEVLALCLALWIAVKQFRDLRRLLSSARSTIEDMFTVLVKSHILYFAR